MQLSNQIELDAILKSKTPLTFGASFALDKAIDELNAVIDICSVADDDIIQGCIFLLEQIQYRVDISISLKSKKDFSKSHLRLVG